MEQYRILKSTMVLLFAAASLELLANLYFVIEPQLPKMFGDATCAVVTGKGGLNDRGAYVSSYRDSLGGGYFLNLAYEGGRLNGSAIVSAQSARRYRVGDVVNIHYLPAFPSTLSLDAEEGDGGNRRALALSLLMWLLVVFMIKSKWKEAEEDED